MVFCFDVHPTRVEAKRLRDELEQYILSLGGSVSDTPAGSDFTVAIGGDGTVVSAWQKSDKPIIGINAGRLGYLTRVEPIHAKEAIKAVFDGSYSLERRMTLDCSIMGESAKNALNEVALLHPDAGVIHFTVSVDGLKLISYAADGMIAATPTGSTGYSLSVGGPIVDPTGEMLILTPIAPHTLVSRPIVLAASSVVTLECEDYACVATDGNTRAIAAGTPLEIKKSDKYMRFVTFGRESFISRLRKKLV